MESGGKIPSITKLKRDPSPKRSHSLGGRKGSPRKPCAGTELATQAQKNQGRMRGWAVSSVSTFL